MLAVVWTFWIAVPLVVGAFAFLAATIIGYLVKVERPKHPPRTRS